MRWTPRWPRRWCASSCGSRTSRPAPPATCASCWSRRRRRSHGSSATCASILHEHGLPQPISNGFVYGYEVDLHWPEHRLIAELDGWLYHGHQRAFETDRERDIVLATHGWRTVRLTAAQLDRRATVAERFTALLRPGHPPPDPDHPPTRGVGT